MRVSACWGRWSKMAWSISLGRTTFPRFVAAAVAAAAPLGRVAVDMDIAAEKARRGPGGQHWRIWAGTGTVEDKDIAQRRGGIRPVQQNRKLGATRGYFVLWSLGASWFRSGLITAFLS